MIIIFFKEQKGELKNTKKRSEFLWLISVERTERFLSMENKLFLSGFSGTFSRINAFVIHKSLLSS